MNENEWLMSKKRIDTKLGSVNPSWTTYRVVSQRYADADQLDIPIHAFDLIVADECHRGYTSRETNVWRATLNHFDAVRVGLTTTAAVHTTSFLAVTA